MATKAQELLAIGAQLGRLGFGYGAIEDLVRIASQLHRLDERSCNGYQDWRGEWDEAAEKRAEKREARLEQRAAAIVAGQVERGTVPAGTRCYHQGDPRGAALYICGPDVPEPIDSHYSRGIAL